MNRDFKLNEPPVACKFPLIICFLLLGVGASTIIGSRRLKAMRGHFSSGSGLLHAPDGILAIMPGMVVKELKTPIHPSHTAAIESARELKGR